MRHLVTTIVVAAVCATAFCTSSRASDTTSNRAVICKVFGRYCQQALRVAWCESRHHTWARNGQYLGLFQMGSSERRIYGHGPGPLAQARAAWRYFAASGYDWSPWSCKP